MHDDADIRDLRLRLYLARQGNRQEFDAHAPDDVEALLERIEELEADQPLFVHRDDYKAVKKRARKARRKRKRQARAVAAVFRHMTDHTFAATVAGGEVEDGGLREDALTVAVYVLPLFAQFVAARETAEQAFDEAERSRCWREMERKRTAAGLVSRLSKDALVERLAIAEGEGLSVLLGGELRKKTKAELADMLALRRCPEPDAPAAAPTSRDRKATPGRR